MGLPKKIFIVVIPGNQKNEKKWIGLSPFFFWKHPPNRSSQKKKTKRERKTGVCLGGKKKKHGSLFPKVVFLSKARKGGFCLHYRKRFLAFSFCFSCVVWTSSSFVVFFLLVQLLRFVAGHFSTSACSLNSVSQRDLLSTYLYIYLLLYKFSWIN